MGNKVIDQFNNRWKTTLFLFTQLPTAFFLGIRILNCTRFESAISLPFTFRSKNPFKSVYFAAQTAAAEISTGVLAIIALDGRSDVVMLVKSVHSTFPKKATTNLIFRCIQGDKIQMAVKEAIEGSDGVEVSIETFGYNTDNEIVSSYIFTWYFRKKQKI